MSNTSLSDSSQTPNPNSVSDTQPTRRDDWMNVDFNILPTTAARNKSRIESVQKRENRTDAEEPPPGLHYVPGTAGKKQIAGDKRQTNIIGDDGQAWLARSYWRLVERSKDEGTNIEELALQLWGSLDKLKAAKRAAESGQGTCERRRHGEGTHSSAKKREESNQNRHRDGRVIIRPSGIKFDKSDVGRGVGDCSDNGDGNHKEWGRRGSNSDRDDRERIRTSHNERRRHEERFKDVNKDNERTSDRIGGFKDRSRGADRGSCANFMRPGDSVDELESRRYQVESDRSSVWSDNRKAKAWRKKRSPPKSQDDSIADGMNVVSRDHSPNPVESVVGCSSFGRTMCAPSVDTEVGSLYLSKNEMNKLSAQILKAQIMGDSKLEKELKDKLSQSVLRDGTHSETQGGTSTVILTQSGRGGTEVPVKLATNRDSKGRQRKVETHDVEGKRVKYFRDDDCRSLNDLVEQEMTSTSANQNYDFLRKLSKASGKTDSDYFTLDDMFVSTVAKKQKVSDVERERQAAVTNQRRVDKLKDDCGLCFENSVCSKHLVVAHSDRVYLRLPAVESLLDNHCVIVPTGHVLGSTFLDEDVWDDVFRFMQALCSAFRAEGKNCVFMETCKNFKKHRHMSIDCFPIDVETFSSMPIYFKKSISECEYEWSDNKKLVDLTSKPLRRSIPKGLPYFCVWFGISDGGFAHVIEDEAEFDSFFGKEVLGNVLDIEPRLWRKPRKQSLADLNKKLDYFSKIWAPFDWTKRS